jgi:hypothetical protein
VKQVDLVSRDLSLALFDSMEALLAVAVRDFMAIQRFGLREAFGRLMIWELVANFIIVCPSYEARIRVLRRDLIKLQITHFE